jgi:aspartate/methionine/tyrosine aminotransferase
MSIKTSEKASSIVRMTMADMADLADARSDAIRLENADAYLPAPPHAIEATAKAVGVDRFNSYLPLHGLRELREAISDLYFTDLGIRYDPETEIVVTSGAGEAMLDVLLTFVAHGDRVLLTNPTYSGMAQRVRLAGGNQVFTNLVEDDGWRLDASSLPRVASGCRVVFYASPCMPTGTVFTEEETQQLADVAAEADAVVVFNASLDKIVYDGRLVTNPAVLKDHRQRTVIIGSVSKNYNMMGWRIGWAVGPRHLIDRVRDVHIFNGIMPSGHSQAGAVAALTGPPDWVSKNAEAYQDHRDTLVAALAGIPGFRLHSPEGGYFLIANIDELGVDSVAFCEQLLEEKNVALTPMVAWGSDDFGDHHVRFIFTNEPPERLVEAGKRIRDFVAARFSQ